MRSAVVASAAAMRAGTGANWSPKWSGTSSVEYPRASAFLAWSAQDRAVPSGALESCAANRNFRGWVMTPSFVVAGVDVDARNPLAVEHVAIAGIVFEGEPRLE